jgi:hypothetical protein
MCTIDIGVLSQKRWHKDDSKACVEFNTKHRCRDFDAVRQSALAHQAPDQGPQDFCKPPRRSDDVFETSLDLSEDWGVLGLDFILLMLCSSCGYQEIPRN